MVLSWANIPLRVRVTRNCEWTTAVDLCQNQDRPHCCVAAIDGWLLTLKLSSFLVELLQPAVVRGYHRDWQQATQCAAAGGGPQWAFKLINLT
jgi:hypothetical protein